MEIGDGDGLNGVVCGCVVLGYVMLWVASMDGVADCLAVWVDCIVSQAVPCHMHILVV